MSKPRYPKNQRLGDIGEDIVRSILRSISIPIKFDPDLGLDFYCELLVNDTPSTPFYIQVKSTEHFNDKWSTSIDKKTIRYWLNQPYPVYLIVYNNKDQECYWLSIEEKRYNLYQKMDTASKSIHIMMNKSNVLGTGEDNNSQFKNKLYEDTLSIAQFMGHPRPKGKGYVKELPGAPRSLIEVLRNVSNLRMIVSSLIHHYVRINDLESAYLCCDFLCKFDKSHYNHFVWFARLHRRLGFNKAAIYNYREALSICNRDTKWPKESMDKLKAVIKKELEIVVNKVNQG